MKLYQSETVLTFGMYIGKSIQNILQDNPAYLVWCVKWLDHFHLSFDTYDFMCQQYPNLVTDALSSMWNKKQNQYMVLNKSNELVISDFNELYNHHDYYGQSGEKYGWYNGWSDDAIDDAFEGDPENTWNVD